MGFLLWTVDIKRWDSPHEGITAITDRTYPHKLVVFWEREGERKKKKWGKGICSTKNWRRCNHTMEGKKEDNLVRNGRLGQIFGGTISLWLEKVFGNLSNGFSRVERIWSACGELLLYLVFVIVFKFMFGRIWNLGVVILFSGLLINGAQIRR